MMQENKPYLVCFDLGGVLIRLIGYNWVQALSAAGIEHLKPENMYALAPLVDRTCNQYEVGLASDEEFEKWMLEAWPEATAEDVWKVLDIWLQGLYDGVGELIETLHANNVPTACLSNTNNRHWTTFMKEDPQYEALWQIQHPFASHIIGAMKPYDEIYEHMEEAMEIDPSLIIFFDDKPENVKAAKKRGWNAHQIDPRKPTVPQMSKILCERYKLIPEPISAS